MSYVRPSLDHNGATLDPTRLSRPPAPPKPRPVKVRVLKPTFLVDGRSSPAAVGEIVEVLPDVAAMLAFVGKAELVST